MKPADLAPQKGTVFTPDDGMFFTMTVTYSDSLEMEYQGVVKATKTTEGGYWVIQQDGTVTDIPTGFHHAQFVEVPKE